MIIGVDTHKRNHTFVNVDGNGRQLKVLTGSTTTEANLAALRWAIAQSDDRLWAVEDNRSMSRRLERDLLLAGERVVRVPTKMMSNCRDGARTYGKSDPIDALAVARAVLREPGLPVAVLDGDERDLRLLFDYRETLVAQRTATISRLRWDLHTLDPTIDPRPRGLSTVSALKALTPIIASHDGIDARLATRRVAACIELTVEINELQREITDRVADLAPALLLLVGFGGLNAARIVAHTAGQTRFRSAAAFARYNGTAPLPVWSRTTNDTVSAAPATANSTAPSTSQRSPKSDATQEHESSTVGGSNKATGPWKHSASSNDASPTPSSAPWPPTRTSKFAPPLDRRATHRTTPRSPARHVRNGRSVLHEPSRSGNDLNGFSVVSSSITPHEARGRRGGCCRRHHCRHDLAR